MISKRDIEKLAEQMESLKRSMENTMRPPEQVILDDVDLREMLKVSKRTTAYWRERGEVTFSKLGGKIYYRLSDILALIKRNELRAINPNINIQ